MWQSGRLPFYLYGFSFRVMIAEVCCKERIVATGGQSTSRQSVYMRYCTYKFEVTAAVGFGGSHVQYTIMCEILYH